MSASTTLTATELRPRVELALARARAAMLASQSPDGSWHGVNDAGSISTAWILVYERYLGALDPRDAQEGVRWLRTQQRADGSVIPWPEARAGTVDATSAWYAGMIAGGVLASDPALARARGFIDAGGGFGAATVTTQVLLVVAGVRDAATLPTIPLFFKLIPGNVRLIGSVLGVDWVFNVQVLAGIIRGLKAGGVPPDPWLHPLAARENRAVLRYLTEHQDPSGSWLGVPFETLLVAATLVALGVPRSDPRVQRALSYVPQVKVYRPDGLYCMAFRSDYWDTAQYVRALIHAGVPADDPAIARAVSYLLAGQTLAPPPWDWQTPPRGAPRTGGWPFEPGNAINPDLDSTQQVLAALAMVAQRTTPSPELARAVREGEAYLRGMQNRDGGWAAFTYGKPRALPGPMYLPNVPAPGGLGWLRGAQSLVDRAANTLVEFGDPSTADVTARVLWTLAELGARPGEAAVRAAIALIKYQRYEGNGAWWGMWAVNFLPSSAYILTGLFRAGESPDEPYIAAALRFIEQHQQDDGAWGETTETYEHPALAGRGPPMRHVSAYCVWALCDAGRAAGDAVSRGVAYLLEHQQPDGLWADTAPLGVMMPNAGYYSNTLFSTYAAVEALAAYLRALP